MENNPATENTPNPDNVVDAFINKIPEVDRAIVQKYVPDWNKGVTERFQAIHKEYEPWKNLGVDFESVQNAIMVMQMAEQDPLEFFKNVRDRLIEMEFDLSDIETPSGNNNTPVGNGSPLPEFEGLNQGFVDRFTKLEEGIESIMNFVNESKSEKENATAQQQLDKILADLENKHGKFDHPAIIARLVNGMNPEEAIKDYKKVIESLNNPQRDTPPPVLGGGRTALDQVDASKVKNGQSRRALIADLLRDAANG